jgi:hypothetical protein
MATTALRSLFSYAALIALALVQLHGESTATDMTLANEAGTLRFTLAVETGKATYRVDHLTASGQSTPVLEPSPLGLTRTDADFTSDLTLVSASKPVIIDETYAMIAGKCSQIRHRGVERTFTLKNKLDRILTLTVQATADGIAFRYGFPGQSSQLRQLIGETTGFKMPATGRVWLQPYDKVATWSPGYEDRYRNGIPIGTVAPAAEGWAFPALFHTNGLWVLITEAGLDTHNYAAHLQPDPTDGLYRVRLPEEPETYGVAPQAASIPLPWVSTWRVVIVGETPGAIVESNLVNNLSAPNSLADTSWIKPGRAAWSWWSDMESPSDFKKQQTYINLAHDLHWEYSLVDLGWDRMTNGGDITQLAAYAKQKGVGLILWYNSGGKHNQVPDADPENMMDDPLVRDAEMARIAALGIKGIKVDFMQSDKQYVIALYFDIMRDAARHHLLIDFHGATLPRGWSRTYPNLLTMEAVSGAEQYWDELFAEEAQTLNTIYAFTRNVVGPMDYTPMIFGNPAHQKPHKTTNAHELALSVIFESGVQHFVSSAESIRAQPAYVQDFLRIVPTTWDETRYVAGEPGQLAVLARRKGDDWYLAGINGEKTAQTVSLTPSFLGLGEFTLELISDGSSPHEFAHSKQVVNKATPLTLSLAARGGFTAHLVRK